MYCWIIQSESTSPFEVESLASRNILLAYRKSNRKVLLRSLIVKNKGGGLVAVDALLDFFIKRVLYLLRDQS
jgi:hypothetical protein